jgi:hypothetical protein
LAACIHRTIQLRPLAFDSNVRLIEPPANPHRPLATGVGRLASARGAIIRRLALEVMWPYPPSAVPTCRHRSAPVTTGRHHLPVGSLEVLPAERVACRPGRDATHHGGRAPGWVERWHRTCKGNNAWIHLRIFAGCTV